MKTDSSLTQSPMVMFLGGSSPRAHPRTQTPFILWLCHLVASKLPWSQLAREWMVLYRNILWSRLRGSIYPFSHSPVDRTVPSDQANWKEVWRMQSNLWNLLTTKNLFHRLQKSMGFLKEFQNSKHAKFLNWNKKYNPSCVTIQGGGSGQQQFYSTESFRDPGWWQFCHTEKASNEEEVLTTSFTHHFHLYSIGQNSANGHL